MRDGKKVPRLANMPFDDDCLYLIYARHFGRILLTCDGHRARSGRGASANTGLRIAAELRQRGGGVLDLGAASQPVSRMLGKLLFYREQWEPFLTDGGSGRVRIGKVGNQRVCPHCRRLTSEDPGAYKAERQDQLPMMESVEVAQGEAYLRAIRQLGLDKPGAKPRGAPFQKKHVAPTMEMELPNGE